MNITIKYRAKLSWLDRYHKYNSDVLCDVVYTIDQRTLEIIDFNFEPVSNNEPLNANR